MGLESYVVLRQTNAAVTETEKSNKSKTTSTAEEIRSVGWFTLLTGGITKSPAAEIARLTFSRQLR